MSLEAFEVAVDFTDKAKHALSSDQLGNDFLHAIQGMGFDYYSCVSCVDFDSMPDDALFMAVYPKGWRDHYLQSQYHTIDRVLQVSKSKNLPFEWTDDSVISGLSKEQKRFVGEAEDAGLGYGITIPIHVIGSYPAAVNVVGADIIADPAVHKAVHLMSIYLHDSATKFALKDRQKSTPAKALTPRELECLRWVVAGKTDWETSIILNISEVTVHTHIENAKRKLGFATRMQTVLKAFFD